jgi:DNA-binding response OmpR family regulator
MDKTSLSDALPTALLIDDNADMLELLEDTLKGRFHCLCAIQGEQGLTMAFETLPDVVICDVMMPGLSGFEVLKQLKASELTDHIPVILLTAKGDMESRLKGWQEKADEYLDKPFNAEELLTRIDNLLGVRNILRKRFQGAMADKPGKLCCEVNKVQAKVSQPKAISEQSNNSRNQVFFDKVYGLLETHYSEEALDVAFLADKLAMSQRQLGRKMKAVLDYTPTELIRVFRLKKAAELLKQGETPSTVAFKVGFSSHSYFSQCFKAQFDCLPSSYH